MIADVERVLVVAAHPDDIDFGAAGTVAAWTKAGIDVTYCVCTSGGASAVHGMAREDVPAYREAEQLAAANEVGVTDVRFLRYQDGALAPSIELRGDITRIIRSVCPDRVLAWSPEINWDHPVTSHPDHRASGEAALAAVFPAAGNPYAHPGLLEVEGLDAWTVRELWIADGPPWLRNHAVDITHTFENKLAALRAHRSQTGHTSGLEAGLRQHFQGRARQHGMPQDRIAEDFQVVRMG
ncbi:MAG: PIG-L deacetylase family protein [Sciscionella sp.]